MYFCKIIGWIFVILWMSWIIECLIDCLSSSPPSFRLPVVPVWATQQGAPCIKLYWLLRRRGRWVEPHYKRALPLIKLGLKKMRTYIHVYIQQCMYIYMYITLHNLYVVHVYPQHTIPELVHVFFIIPPLPPSSISSPFLSLSLPLFISPPLPSFLSLSLPTPLLSPSPLPLSPPHSLPLSLPPFLSLSLSLLSAEIHVDQYTIPHF